MAQQLNRLTARTVATLTKTGRHADGGNLYLTISQTGGALSRRWTFMYLVSGKQREAGFGPLDRVTLADAREIATEWRRKLKKGIDPLDEKKATKEAEAARRTFGECADELITSKQSEWRSPIHGRQWRMTLDIYCKPLRDKPVAEISTEHVLGVLKPLWQEIPETASRLRGRIEAVLDYAKAHDLRSGENPAAWKGHLALILPKRQKLSRSHHAALSYHEIPAFVAKLRERDSIPVLALEFVILTVARAGEVLGAKWGEIDLEGKVWIVPASRMKAGREHRVPLPARASEIIDRMAAMRSGDFVFPGQRRDKGLGQASLWRLCSGAGTVHGFRSSFRDWCGDQTSFPREIAEHALAHATGSAVEQAYRRGDAIEKRRGLMEAWASYVDPRAQSNVVSIGKAR